MTKQTKEEMFKIIKRVLRVNGRNALNLAKIYRTIGEKNRYIMIGDCLQRMQENLHSHECCPNCGGEIDYQKGQQSFPETGQRDFPSEYYCIENEDNCERSQVTNNMGKELGEYENATGNILELRKKLSGPIDNEPEAMEFMYKLVLETNQQDDE